MAVSTRAASEMKRLIRIDYLLDSHHATQRGQLMEWSGRAPALPV
jgi:hypothetical protein